PRPTASSRSPWTTTGPASSGRCGRRCCSAASAPTRPHPDRDLVSRLFAISPSCTGAPSSSTGRRSAAFAHACSCRRIKAGSGGDWGTGNFDDSPSKTTKKTPYNAKKPQIMNRAYVITERNEQTADGPTERRQKSKTTSRSNGISEKNQKTTTNVAYNARKSKNTSDPLGAKSGKGYWLAHFPIRCPFETRSNGGSRRISAISP